MRRRGMFALSFVLPAVTVPMVASCGEDPIYVYIVSDAGDETVDSSDAGAPDGSEDAGDEDAGPSCSADCVLPNPSDFGLPLLLWVGPAGQAPTCPLLAPVREPGDFFSDLDVPAGGCPACSCKPSTASCAPPATMTAHAALCSGVSAVDTSFDPPTAWDGSCSADNPIPAQAQCPPGSGIPCVQSLTIGAMAKDDEKCEPDLPPDPKITAFVAPSWGRVGVACQGYTDPPFAGCGPGALCVPEPEPGSGFRHCVKREGDHACPEEGYTDKLLFYAGYEDKRGCTACACGAPEGGVCTATVSVFKDSACTDPLFLGVPAGSNGAPCHDIIGTGQPLGSKSISNVTYYPGTCQATGGEVEGSVESVGPATFCCLP